MKRLKLAALVFFTSTVTALAQGNFEGGLKGGATFTHGHTTIPSVPLSASLAIPQLNNQNNGVGYGYSFGLWGRQNFNKFFIQVEVDYNRFVLNQKTDFTVPAAVAAVLAGQTLPAQIPASTPASINTVSESVLESVNVPILFGKKWAGGKVRAFIGPNLLFTTKAQAKRTSTATILSLSIPTPETTSDLKNPNPQSPTESILEVKSFTYAAEIGVGYTFFNRLDLDARYAAPVGGIYKNKDITGYLGIATLSLGIRLF
ncbi:outer membrane beta-barrel protein [Spirosoma endbachense]|uniref:Outer membrane beta-barrel protein n=1 Tax=Spirosoma endbachense TaxID=2666025 RepID=A0A6P1VU48_9BACT|nr:outer membrane beta-barrel protein [Spirosoma endbachense]QHV95928.1 outer membrane beta-barrel protein [Spirosoma endbachense]